MKSVQATCNEISYHEKLVILNRSVIPIKLLEYISDVAILTFRIRVKVMVINATFNNISIILWQSVLLVEETGVPRENHRPVVSH